TEIYTLSLHDALPISRRAYSHTASRCALPIAEKVNRESYADAKRSKAIPASAGFTVLDITVPPRHSSPTAQRVRSQYSAVVTLPGQDSSFVKESLPLSGQ